MALAVGILVDDATVEIENIHRNIGAAEAVRPRDPRRRAADRGAGVRVDAVHLHRVRAGRVHHRRGEVAVRAARAGGRVRDADVVLPVAHARADDGALPARAARPTARGHARRTAFSASSRVRPRLRAAAHALRRAGSRWRSQHRGVRRRRRSCAFVAGSLGAAAARRARLLPDASTPASSSCTCAARPARASRRPRSASRRSSATIRSVIPPREIDTMLDNIGTPYSGINLSLSEGALISSADGADPDRAQARATRRRPSTCARCARRSRATYPETTFFFLAPDISTQVLNFGLAAPIDVQVVGADRQRGRDATRSPSSSRREVAKVPGAADVHLAQVTERAGARDRRRSHDGAAGRAHRARRRERPARLAVVERRRSRRRTGSTKRGVQYLVAVQTPQYEIDSVDALRRDADLDARTAQPQTARQRRDDLAHDGAGEHHALQRRAHVRRPGQRRRHRSRLGQRRDRASRRRDARARCRAGTRDHDQGPGREHGQLVPRPRLRPAVRGRCSSTC